MLPLASAAPLKPVLGVQYAKAFTPKKGVTLATGLSKVGAIKGVHAPGL